MQPLGQGRQHQFSASSLKPVLDECHVGCDLVAGTAATMKASLVDGEESFHS